MLKKKTIFPNTFKTFIIIKKKKFEIVLFNRNSRYVIIPFLHDKNYVRLSFYLSNHFLVIYKIHL